MEDLYLLYFFKDITQNIKTTNGGTAHIIAENSILSKQRMGKIIAVSQVKTLHP